MDVKTTSSNGNLEVYIDQLKRFLIGRKKKRMVCEFKKNQYTDLNKFSSNSISSLIIILFILDLRKNHF
jgi:hypothetical protein